MEIDSTRVYSVPVNDRVASTTTLYFNFQPWTIFRQKGDYLKVEDCNTAIECNAISCCAAMCDTPTCGTCYSVCTTEESNIDTLSRDSFEARSNMPGPSLWNRQWKWKKKACPSFCVVVFLCHESRIGLLVVINVPTDNCNKWSPNTKHIRQNGQHHQIDVGYIGRW